MGDQNISIFTIFFIASFTIILFFNLFNVFRTLKTAKQNSKMPRIRAHCMIVSHRKSETVTPRNRYKSTLYYLTVEYDTRDQCEYLVSSDTYSFFVDGDEGMITVRGSEFISFELGK